MPDFFFIFFGIFLYGVHLQRKAQRRSRRLSRAVGQYPAATPREITNAHNSPRPIREVFGDGDFEVGVDIEPGNYLSLGKEPYFTIWKRLRDFTGEGVICSGGGAGPCIVTILPTDKGFESHFSGGWIRIDEKQT
jgi:hypothetical protein